jgi:MFS transporter, PAT family, beta-lactamase induction signal transducer AmpG
MPSPHRVPLWLMGLTNLSYGRYGGVVAFAVPQPLGNRNVPETAIVGLTTVAFSTGFYAFLLSPILDVRFSRRWYAVAQVASADNRLPISYLHLRPSITVIRSVFRSQSPQWMAAICSSFFFV